MQVTITLEHDGDLGDFMHFAPFSLQLRRAWNELLPDHPLREMEISTGKSLHSITFDVPMEAGNQDE